VPVFVGRDLSRREKWPDKSGPASADGTLIPNTYLATMSGKWRSNWDQTTISGKIREERGLTPFIV
jgi:hypothetical protein